MSVKAIARGSATRTANKNKRREHILNCAGKLIAERGLDGFTLAELAERAEVTVPTIHNLLGRKSQIFERLVEELVSGVDEALTANQILDPISAVEAFVNKLMEFYASNEELYRAAFAAGERTKQFTQTQPDGVFAYSLSLAEQVCQNGKDQGYLLGSIETKLLATQLFAAQRLSRQDWMYGYIDLKEYRTRVLLGMFITLCADAEPKFKKRLSQRIEALTAKTSV